MDHGLMRAITDAMTDFITNRRDFTPLRPAICWEQPEGQPSRFYYGSGYSGDLIICDLTEVGFGSFAPETAEDVEAAAEAFANELWPMEPKEVES